MSANKILCSIEFGTCKRFKILPIFWIELRLELKLHFSQWCLGYKVVRIGFLSIYFHSPM